jgi:signal transduction histidine kinase
MLDLSKLESGTQALTMQRLDISQRLREIAQRYEGISDSMGYHLTFTGDAPCMVCCDSGKIERVICNLLNNAINYTSKETRQVYLRQINRPDCVRIEITDEGDGIEEDKIKLIFDKYYRSENHKREVVGTGLGLSIVKAILKMHHYNYGVNSKLGEGSTFWFEMQREI